MQDEEAALRRDITRLWREIFNDGEEYIELVMRSGFLPDCSPMIRQDGRTIAMAVGLRYDFKDKEGRGSHGLYVCGVSTLPQYRGLGEAGKILRYLDSRIAEGYADFLFLIPANERLRKYYTHYGYETASWRRPGLYDAIWKRLYGESINIDLSNGEKCNSEIDESNQYSDVDNKQEKIVDINRNIIIDNKHDCIVGNKQEIIVYNKQDSIVDNNQRIIFDRQINNVILKNQNTNNIEKNNVCFANVITKNKDLQNIQLVTRKYSIVKFINKHNKRFRITLNNSQISTYHKEENILDIGERLLQNLYESESVKATIENEDDVCVLHHGPDQWSAVIEEWVMSGKVLYLIIGNDKVDRIILVDTGMVEFDSDLKCEEAVTLADRIRSQFPCEAYAMTKYHDGKIAISLMLD